MMGGLAGASIGHSVFEQSGYRFALKKTRQIKNLEPGAYQHQIRRAGRQQGDGKGDVDALAGGFEDRSHDRQNIGRF